MLEFHIMNLERKINFGSTLESKLQEKPKNENDKKTEKLPGACAANKKERRKCPVVTVNYESCHDCPFSGYKEGDINLGQEGLRGGIEDSRASAAWRKNKLIHGIPHGDD